MKRRNFVKNSAAAGIGLSFLGIYSCKQTKKEGTDKTGMEGMEEVMEPFFKLSLAQWSVHRMIWNGEMDPYEFASKAKEWGFTGLEYVSQLYDKELKADNYSAEAMAAFVDKSNAEAEKHGMQNVLIMIDGQGDLATSDSAERKKAAENHFKWVDAAKAMGCHAIRVNLAGSTEPEAWIPNSVDGLSQLATYAKEKNINILVENHGGLSSNAAMLVEVMTKVGMDNCGTLPDFGNFCIRRNDPADYASGCAEMYDVYKGVEELMPFAMAVSAKTHNFDEDGNETVLDYTRMMQIVKDAGYTGFIGVEYEGNEIGEAEGIMATKDLMLKSAAETA
jgi:sugar phosphate isomerase/epimerase